MDLSRNQFQTTDSLKARARKRRAYLLERMEVNLLALTGAAILVAFALLTFSFVATDTVPGDCDLVPCATPVQYNLTGFCMVAIPGAIAAAGARMCRCAIRRSHRIAYVPPVREQISCMAADEVLLRGASVPRDRNLLTAVGVGGAASRDGLLHPAVVLSKPTNE